jgi:hypothetical protein
MEEASTSGGTLCGRGCRGDGERRALRTPSAVLLHADPPPPPSLPPSAVRAYGRIEPAESKLSSAQILPLLPPLPRPAGGSSICVAVASFCGALHPFTTPSRLHQLLLRRHTSIRAALSSSCGSSSSPPVTSSDLSWAARITVHQCARPPCGQEPSPC